MSVSPLRRRRVTSALGLTLSLLALPACAGSSDSTSSQATSAAGASGAVAGAGVDLAAAKAQIAPLLNAPSAFPIDTPLGASAKGKRIAYMDCGSTVCGLFFTLGEPAAKALGMSLTRIKAGLSADSVAAAFDSVVQAKYDGVFVPAIQPSLWKRGLDQLVAAKIPVVTSGVTGADPAKVGVSMVSDAAINRAGKLMASYVVADTGDKSDVVIYITPEIAFNPVLQKAFLTEMKTLCPSCKARAVNVPAATMGTRAPALITDDLQAHPKTTSVVFGEANQAAGLPAALKTANISVKTFAVFPDPATLSLIKSGDLTAGLGVDLPVVAWTLMDSLARLTTGQPAAPGAKGDLPPMQFLTAANLPADVSRGWTGYPDFPQRFMTLWKTTS